LSTGLAIRLTAVCFTISPIAHADGEAEANRYELKRRGDAREGVLEPDDIVVERYENDESQNGRQQLQHRLAAWAARRQIGFLVWLESSLAHITPLELSLAMRVGVLSRLAPEITGSR
jgi:hypothetical protein